MRSRRARPIFFAVAARHDFHCVVRQRPLQGRHVLRLDASGRKKVSDKL
jgi:hypothetical protein